VEGAGRGREGGGERGRGGEGGGGNSYFSSLTTSLTGTVRSIVETTRQLIYR
jgi:hypothetical protein